MGTWNATCAATQLPIVEGRPVVMIPLILKTPDYLARDTIAGGGSSANDVLAQPLSPPLRGTYNGGGGISPSKQDKGQPYLEETLRAYVETGRLYKLKSAEPVVCKKLPSDYMALLSAGDLLVMTPNPRKGWLESLRKVYDETEDKKSMSHYKAQLKVDPATLPDMLPMPLALNLVSATLYDALAHKVGMGQSFDRWNEAKGKTDVFKGNRAKQIESDFALKPAAKKKIEMAITAVGERAARILEGDEEAAALMTPEQMKKMEGRLTYLLLKKEVPTLFESAERQYFAPHGATAAIKDAMMNDDTSLRDELVKFDLFSCAMDQMRKQWVPQSGAGRSSGLEEPSTRELYELTGQFISSSCGLNASDNFEP